MARAIAGFPADRFRAGIRKAMLMSMPVDEDKRPLFVTVVQPDSADVDDDGVPWDPAGVALEPTLITARPLCALDSTPKGDDKRTWGELQRGEVAVTLLDEEYAQVKGFDYMVLWQADQDEGVRYHYRRVLERTALDAVGVWTLLCSTEDEV